MAEPGPQVEIWRVADLVRRLKISRTTLWRLCRDGKSGFPKPLQISQNVVGWRARDIEKWLESRPEA